MSNEGFDEYQCAGANARKRASLSLSAERSPTGEQNGALKKF